MFANPFIIPGFSPLGERLAMSALVFVFSLLVAALMMRLSGIRRRVKSRFGFSVCLLACALFIQATTIAAGTKPSPVVTTKGIKITKCVANSKAVSFAWTCTDPAYTNSVYVVEGYLVGTLSSHQWFPLGETSATNFVHTGFTVDQTYLYRIRIKQ